MQQIAFRTDEKSFLYLASASLSVYYFYKFNKRLESSTDTFCIRGLIAFRFLIDFPRPTMHQLRSIYSLWKLLTTIIIVLHKNIPHEALHKRHRERHNSCSNLILLLKMLDVMLQSWIINIPGIMLLNEWLLLRLLAVRLLCGLSSNAIRSTFKMQHE